MTLEFEQLYQDTIRLSRTVDDVAHAALHAEMRDMHIKIYELTDIAASIENKNVTLSYPGCTTTL